MALCVISIVAIAAAQAVKAQPAERPAATTDQAAIDEGAGEVVVTAGKRATNLVDTDYSVTVLNREQLDEARVRNLRQIDRLIPNVRFNAQSQLSDLYISIRGVESNPFIVNRAAVYLDGIPFRELSNAVLNQVDSVEVLRGPQSMLYGANSESGLLLVNTRQPGQTRHAELRATGTLFSSGEGGTLDGFLSGPLTGDTLAGSVAFKLERQDGYLRNLTPADGRKAHVDQVYLQGRLRWTPNDAVTVNALGYVLNTDAPGLFEYEYLPIDLDLYNRVYSQTFNRGLTTGRFSYANDAPKNTRKRERVIGLSASWDVGYGALAAAVSYRYKSSVGRGYDLDFTATPIVAGAIFLSDKVTNAEVRYVSPDAKLFQFIVGASLYNERKGNTIGTLIGAGGLYDYNRAPLQFSKGRDYGLFATASYAPPVLPGLKASVGFRYDRARRASRQTAGPLDLGPSGIINYADVDRARTFTQSLPRFALSYKVTEDLNLFANAAKGYVPGGFNLAAVQAGIDLDSVLNYDSETLWSREAGVKWRLPNGAGYLSAAAFRIVSSNWQEIQVATDAQGRPVTSDYIGADASIRSQGIELEASYRPLPGLTLLGNFGSSDAKYRRLLVRGGADLRGNRVKLVPRYTGYAAARYQHPSGFYGRVEASFTGRIALDERNRAFQPATTVLGAQAGWENDRYGVRLFVENATNRRRFSGLALNNLVFGTDGTLYGPLDAPRVGGFELSARF